MFSGALKIKNPTYSQAVGRWEDLDGKLPEKEKSD
jgi:hypothetical protein